MKADYTIISPNYEVHSITVEFIVLHFTAGNLERALELFMDTSSQVSAHIIISENGEVYEIVPCLQGQAYKAWHSGKSKWFDGVKLWQEFNNYSIGIELVNLNGNIFPYTEQQYKSLEKVISHLKILYPVLNSGERVLGHEQIADWRGKADPGIFFDWRRFYEVCYPEQVIPPRPAACPIQLQISLQNFLQFIPEDKSKAKLFWHELSYMSETVIGLIKNCKNFSQT